MLDGAASEVRHEHKDFPAKLLYYVINTYNNKSDRHDYDGQPERLLTLRTESPFQVHSQWPKNFLTVWTRVNLN